MDKESGRLPSVGADASKTVAVSGILSAIVAVLTFIIIPVPPPVGGFDASSILILSLPIILGAELGTVIVCLGEFVGTLFLLTVGLALPYYLPGIVAVRGAEAYLVGKIAGSSLFGKGKEGMRQLLAISVGPMWETAGFIVANYYLYYLFYGPEMAVAISFLLLSTLIDLLWVIPALAVVAAVRNAFGTTHLEMQLGFNARSVTRGTLFKVSAGSIILAWILLLLVPFVFTSWFI